MMVLSKKEESSKYKQGLTSLNDENFENISYGSQPKTPIKLSNKKINSNTDFFPSTPSFKESKLKSKYGNQQSVSLWHLQSNIKFENKDLFDAVLSQRYNDSRQSKEKEDELASQKFDIQNFSQASIFDTPLQEQENELNLLLDNIENPQSHNTIKIKEDPRIKEEPRINKELNLKMNHFRSEKKRIINNYKEKSHLLIMEKKQKISELNEKFLVMVGKIKVDLYKKIEKLKVKYNANDNDILEIEHKLFSKKM